MLVFLLVSQMIIAGAPTPEQSAHILAQLDSPSNFSKRFVCTDCDGPHAGVIPSRAGDGPFGPFPQYYFPPLGFGSFYHGGYFGNYYGAGSGWSQGPYVAATPFASRTGARRGGAVVNTAPSPPAMSGGSAGGFRSRPPVPGRR